VPSFETAAQSLKVVPINAPVHSDAEIETAIMALGREPGGGLVVMPGVFTFAHRAPIILAAARNNVSAVLPRSSDLERSDQAASGRCPELRKTHARCSAWGANRPKPMKAIPITAIPPPSQASSTMPVMTAAAHSTMPIWKAAEANS
jgi:hypothetical protein